MKKRFKTVPFHREFCKKHNTDHYRQFCGGCVALWHKHSKELKALKRHLRAKNKAETALSGRLLYDVFGNNSKLDGTVERPKNNRLKLKRMTK